MTSTPSEITLTPAGVNRFTVTVNARQPTTHHVTVSPAYLRELGLADHAPARVVHEAFLFLLERESNTSVLTKFDLPEIERYFPEFRQEIAQRLNR